MSLPVGLTPVEVRGRYVRVDGSVATGTVSFTPLTRVNSAALDLTVVAESISTPLDASGSFTATVTAGDDAQLDAQLYLQVVEKIGGATNAYTILVPESATADGLDLADVAPVVPVETHVEYVLASDVGRADGVAPLGSDGVVPDIHLPPASGGIPDHGDLTGLADDDHLQYHTDVRGDARYYTQTQLDTTLATKADSSHAHDLTGYATDTELTTAIGNHESAADPHPGYAPDAHIHDYAATDHDHPGATVTASPEGSPPAGPAVGDVWVVI